MRMYITVLLRCLLYVSLALMVYDYVRIDMYFEMMGRGYIDEFSVYVSTWRGTFCLIVAILLVVINIIDFIVVKKNKHAHMKEYILTEYDVADERAVVVTGKAVRFAFVFILFYTFLLIGSYMFIPNYFLDYPWYPIFTTASIPVFGLIIYLVTFKYFHAK
ncbi:hypothetical protein [Psychrobacillus soli]|uniref:Uncharacterized protein n=1 Tax=Psychrobacillus soli TaxID=1543965 RepID=A0A544TKJ1_9BACI|nr:hypothetical protein [Psychrobacillus soli]TQR17948.1 hypothetical protein FG383_03610 [Psychrobacillus soli]